MSERGARETAKMGGAILLLTASLVLIATGGSAAPGDLVFPRATAGGPYPPSIFPHWIHRIHHRCSVCHPRIFEMAQGANEVTMDRIGKGEFCGACHKGRIAFAVGVDTCDRCHREPEE